MTHTTPPPPEDIQALSAFMDGMLPPDEAAVIEKRLVIESALRAEYDRLLCLRGLTGRQTRAPEPGDDSMWQQIAGQLKADKHMDEVLVDAEFICAYHDCELPLDDPAVVRFEQQLYANAEHNQVLADVACVSEAIRRFGFRIEERCTIDVCGDVMAVYCREVAVPVVAVPEELPAVMVEISAWADGELHDAAVEGDASCRAQRDKFTALSKEIKRISALLEAQAPDMWPAVARELGVADKNVIPLTKPRKPTAIRFWAPVAAVALLLLMAGPLWRQVNPSAMQMETDRVSLLPASSSEVGQLQKAAPERMLDARQDVVGGDGNANIMPVQKPAAPAEEKDLAAGAAGKPMTANAPVVSEPVDSMSADNEIASVPPPVMPEVSRQKVYRDEVSQTAQPMAKTAMAAPMAMTAGAAQRAVAGGAGGAAASGSVSSLVPSAESFLMDSIQNDGDDDDMQAIMGL